MSQTNILIFGATGYVAGTLFFASELPHVSITVLVRSADKAKKLRKLNLGPLKVVEGSPTTDAALLVDLLKDTDLLIDSVIRLRHLVGAQNIAAALRKWRRPPSGAGVLLDDALGRDIPNKMGRLRLLIHRNVDLEFLKADEDGVIYSYLVIPGGIFARPSGVLVDAECDCPPQPVMIGEGLNYLAIVELHEFVDFLVLLVTELLSSEWEQVPHGKEGYFFIENGSVQLREVSLTAARAMTGKVVSKGRPITEIIMHILGGNSHCVSTRARHWAEFLREVEAYTLENVNKKKYGGCQCRSITRAYTCLQYCGILE
ncbi:hypothetical protein CPB85DRAFT_1339322 [Mucidula mucida]|nr:hypothetical protein CPB85DRAFT_1339322 [Mucidula mucida]